MIGGCDRHRDLLGRIDDGTASDADVDAYDEVLGCPDCQRRLSTALNVHPAVLRQGGMRSMEEGWAKLSQRGWPELAAQVAQQPAPRWPRYLLGAGVVVAAAALLVATFAPLQHDRSTVVRRAAPRPAPAVARPAPRPAPAPAKPMPVEVDVIVPADVEDEDDAVASVEPSDEPDWPAPAFVDLMGGSLKAAGTTRSAQLELVAVDADTVRIAVVTSTPAELAVCVGGPETGMLWRGAVPAGRTSLSRAQQQLHFRYDAAGTYRFVLTRDLTDCRDPVHVVEVVR